MDIFWVNPVIKKGDVLIGYVHVIILVLSDAHIYKMS